MAKLPKKTIKKYYDDRERKIGNKNSKLDNMSDYVGGYEALEDIKEHINAIIYIVNGNSTDWLEIKDLLAKYMSHKYSKFLSKKDLATKKQKPNDFDYAIMNYWKEETGVELTIPKDKLHPEQHIYRPKGWNIVAINEARRRKAIAEGRMEDSPSKFVSKLNTQKRRGRPDGYNKYTKTVAEYFESLDQNFNQRDDHTSD